jgi:uncharacterized protein YodC (DUF2158 family)
MNKFNVGDRVRVESGGTYCYGGYDGVVGQVLSSEMYSYVKLQSGQVRAFPEDDLTKVEPSLDTLMLGDVLVDNTDDYLRTVQGLMGNIVFYTHSNGESYFESIEELKEYSWKLKSASTEAPVTTMTVEEVAKKLGIDNLHIIEGSK